VYLIFDVVLGTGLAGVIAGALGLWFLFVWYVQPLWQLVRLQRRGASR
jgi:hypothetical protein